jgi:hypothetical protein
MEERIKIDPVLVAGSLVGANFEGRGYIVRREFVGHPRVQRWLTKHRSPPFKVMDPREFEQLAHEAIRD